MALFIAPFWLTFLLLRNSEISFRQLTYYALAIILSLLFGVLVDYWGYGKLTFAPYHYFYQNLVLDKAAGYGEHPWYWYILSLFKVLLNPFMISGIFGGMYYLREKEKIALVAGLLVFFLAHSYLDRKAERFLLPMLPVALYFYLRFMLTMNDKSAPSRIEKILLWPAYHRVFRYLSVILVLGYTLFGQYRNHKYYPAFMLEDLPENSRVILSNSVYQIYQQKFSKAARIERPRNIFEYFDWADVFYPPHVTLVRTETQDFRKACQANTGAYVFTSHLDRHKDGNLALVDHEFTGVVDSYPYDFFTRWGRENHKRFGGKWYTTMKRFKIINCEVFLKSISEREISNYRGNLIDYF